jgi:hypothetical protein
VLGDSDAAIAVLERAYKDGEPLLFAITSLDWFEPLHEDPRFKDLARRLGLPE